MTRIRFHRAAALEAEAAVRWYNERLAGLGDDFRGELTAAVERVGEQPQAWPIGPHDPRTRRHRLSRFPYSVVFVIRSDGAVTVAAVAHAKRRPGYWRSRI